MVTREAQKETDFFFSAVLIPRTTLIPWDVVIKLERERHIALSTEDKSSRVRISV